MLRRREKCFSLYVVEFYSAVILAKEGLRDTPLGTKHGSGVVTTVKPRERLVFHRERLFEERANAVGLVRLPTRVRDWTVIASSLERAIMEFSSLKFPGAEHLASSPRYPIEADRQRTDPSPWDRTDAVGR
jgi:hypothetical protein